MMKVAHEGTNYAGQSKLAVWAVYAACAWASIFAAAHYYWALGGTWLLGASQIKESVELLAQRPLYYWISWMTLSTVFVLEGLFPLALARSQNGTPPSATVFRHPGNVCGAAPSGCVPRRLGRSLLGTISVYSVRLGFGFSPPLLRHRPPSGAAERHLDFRLGYDPLWRFGRRSPQHVGGLVAVRRRPVLDDSVGPHQLGSVQ